MNENSDFIRVNESNADSYSSSTTISQLVAFLSDYESKYHNMTVLVEDQVLSINENDESIYNLSFEARSRNGLKVKITTKFIDKDYDNLKESIPLIRFKGTNLCKYDIGIGSNSSPVIYHISIKQLKKIYQHFEKSIPLFTMPIEDEIVTIPITLDGIQIDITIKKICQNQYVVTEIDI